MQPTLTSGLVIRDEADADYGAITDVTVAAFRTLEISQHTEQFIVLALRKAGALSVSLVAERNGRVVGHIAFSRVRIDGGDIGWFGLAPLALLPEWQKRGIGAALVNAGLEDLQRFDAAGCVVLGDPNYYSRFGFAHDPALTFPGAQLANYFQRLVLRGEAPRGEVSYPAAFG